MEFARALWSTTSQGRPEGVIFVSLLFITVLGTLSLRDGSYVHTRTSYETTFSEPWALRAFLTSWLVCFVFACASMVWDVFGHKPFPWLMVALLCVAATIGFFHLLGPNQIVFNPQQRSYHSISRWSWPPQIRSGSYDELNGIFVRRVSVKSGFYSVSLAWKDGSEWATRLGRFSERAGAEAFAAELSQALALPRVEPPNLRKKKLPSSKTK